MFYLVLALLLFEGLRWLRRRPKARAEAITVAKPLKPHVPKEGLK